MDLNVKATLLRHGNYDYASKDIVWDPAIAERNLPASLIYSGKPAWFGNRPWPPVDPENPGSLALDSLPAGYRFLHGVPPPSGQLPGCE